MNKFLLTLTAGIAIGILIAPRKGSETRKILSDGLDDLKNDFDKFFKEEEKMLSDAVKTVAEGAVARAQNLSIK